MSFESRTPVSMSLQSVLSWVPPECRVEVGVNAFTSNDIENANIGGTCSFIDYRCALRCSYEANEMSGIISLYFVHKSKSAT